MERLRVVTFNIWHNQGPWERRLALIRREIEALAPDLVGLQEVLRMEPPPGSHQAPLDQAAQIADGLGYDVVHAPAEDCDGGLTFGNALLSRHPMAEHQLWTLPGEETGERRSLLYALVNAPCGLVPMFVTHLNWKLHQGKVRVRQVKFIAQHLRELAPVGTNCFPPILAGDFNAEPESDEIRFLRGYATLDGESVFFADAWAWGGNGGPGFTFDRRNPYARRSHEPPRRIDYIFVRGPDRLLRGEPLEARIVFDVPDGDVWPSDHFGVLTDLSAMPRRDEPL